jgi:hypothetical protein
MWAYPWSTYPDRPSLEELSVARWKPRFARSWTLPLGAGPDPLRRGITSIRVGTSGPISTAFTILSLHRARDIVQGLGDSRGNTWALISLWTPQGE